ncbi:MAG: hypothetical protein QOI41_6267 [Myxococcales bacterium]|jgi:hypothetical protein|nr:hypothetical protein [Myxococcales bacterium]
MEAMQDLVRTYLESWNEKDAKARRSTIDRIFAEQCTYVDPNAGVAGRDGIDALLEAVQKQFSGVVFVLAGAVDSHHEVARFTWHAMAPGLIAPVAIGFDVLVTEGGRIREVVGFLDKAPS